MQVADTLLVTGLAGMSETERKEKIWSRLKGSLAAHELPSMDALSSPTTRAGALAPIAFLKCGRIETRKKAHAALKGGGGGIGARVASGPSSERINRYLISAAKDIGAHLKMSDSDQRRRVTINFRQLSVALDGKDIVKRAHTDTFSWDGMTAGDNVKRLTRV